MARRPKPMIDPEFDRRMMAAALRVGRRNMGQTNPNPAVGCVIVNDDHVVIARGATAPGGRPHAEQEALAAAGDAARGATAYVTLEPCAHKGRTKSCTVRLIEAGVARVVTAMADPDPRTNGAGHAALTEAGIAVTTGVLAEEAARAHSGHISRIAKGRPHVALKLAVSADGMIGRRQGERMIITSKPAFDMVQMMRTEFDAVMVGIGTVLVDDPRLNVRLPGLENRSPARIILDASARLPPAGALLTTAKEVPVIVFIGPDVPEATVAALNAAGAVVHSVGPASGGVDLAAALAILAKEGHARVFCEGGAKVAASLVAADLLDEVIVLRAPVVVGPDGVRALAGMALSAIERSPRYRLVETADVGEDVMRRYIRAA